MSSLGYVNVRLTAAGNSSATALVLPVGAAFNQISLCDAGAGVRLPVQAPGTVVYVRNDSVRNCNCYPVTGSAINAGNPDIPFVIGPDSIIGLIYASSSLTFLISQGYPSIVSIQDDYLCSFNDNGKTFGIDQSVGGGTLTLPDVVSCDGLIIKTVLTNIGAHDFFIDAGLNNLYGTGIACGAAAGSACLSLGPAVAHRYLKYASALAVLGDYANFISDGSAWNVVFQTSSTNGIVISN